MSDERGPDDTQALLACVARLEEVLRQQGGREKKLAHAMVVHQRSTQRWILAVLATTTLGFLALAVAVMLIISSRLRELRAIVPPRSEAVPTTLPVPMPPALTDEIQVGSQAWRRQRMQEAAASPDPQVRKRAQEAAR